MPKLKKSPLSLSHWLNHGPMWFHPAAPKPRKASRIMIPTKLPLRRTGVSRRISSAHSASRPSPARISSSGHQRPYHDQNWPAAMCAAQDQQGHHANGDQNDRANNRRNARTISAAVAGLPRITLRLPGIALCPPRSLLLLAVHPPLGLRIVRRIRRRRSAARRHIRRYAAHDCPPLGSFPKSCGAAGTIAVACPG